METKVNVHDEYIKELELRCTLEGLMRVIVPVYVNEICRATGQWPSEKEGLDCPSISDLFIAAAALKRIVELYNIGRATKEDINNAMMSTELRHLKWSQIAVERPPWVEPAAWNKP